MYQYILVLIYVYFRKDIKWGQVPYNLRELLKKIFKVEPGPGQSDGSAPAKYPDSETLLRIKKLKFHSNKKVFKLICSGRIRNIQ